VVVADPEAGSGRIYRRGEQTFAPGAKAGEIVDGQGRRWTVGEEALTAVEGEGEGGEGAPAPLERLPGHQAFWFGWYSFFPESELYGAPPR
jgi:hypothetical protein